MKAQKSFIAAASHELKSPLTVMQLNINEMTSLIEEENIQQYLDSTNKECQRMTKLVQDMLELASKDAGKWDLNLQLEDISTIAMEAYEQYKLLCRDKKIQLYLELPEEIIEDTLIDRQSILQVLMILLDNAITYSDDNKKIILRVEQDNNRIIVSVIDYGIGIEDLDKQYIFERFYQAENSRTDKSHFGLGLSIAKEIIEQHNANIEVLDTIGGGTTFKLYFSLFKK